MTQVGRIAFPIVRDEDGLIALKQAVSDLQDRVRELEHAIFIDDDIEDSVIDPLEVAHQRLANSIRVHREGNS
jgi:hypothetical protein